MAQFNYSVDSNAPDYTGVSKGFTSKLQGVADLFKDVGNLGLAAVNIIDQNNTENQKELIQKGVDSALNDFGMRTAGNETTGTPPELAGYAKQLAATHKAYLAGSLKESNFQMRIDALSRKVRSMYPGYEDQIDTIVNQTLNRSTANDLRKQLWQEWDQEQQNVGEDDKRFAIEVTQARNEGWLPPDYDKNPSSFSKAAVRSYIAEKALAKAKIEAEQRDLTLRKEKRDVTHKELVDSAQTVARRVSNQALQAGLEGVNVQGLLRKIQTTSMKDFSPEEVIQINSVMSSLETQVRTSASAQLGTSNYDTLTKEERDNAIETAMEPVNILKKAVLDKDIGLVSVFKGMADMKTEAAMQNYLNSKDPSVDAVKRYQVMQKLLPPEMLQQYLLENPNFKDGLNKSMGQMVVSKLLSGEQTLEESIAETAKSTGKADPAMTTGIIVTALNMAQDPKAPAAVTDQLLQSFYTEDNGSFIDRFSDVKNRSGESDRMVMFGKMASPQMTALVKKASVNNPELMGKYKSFMQDAFVSLFKADVNAVSDSRLYSDTVDIKWDPEKSQFTVTPKPGSKDAIGTTLLAGGLPGGMPVFAANAWQMWKDSNAKQSVDKMNRYLSMLKPAMEASGDDTNMAITELMSGMGIYNNPKNGKGNILYQLYDALVTSPTLEKGNKGTKAQIMGPAKTIFDQPTQTDALKGLRDFIGEAEGADYNTLNGGRKLPLVNMTIAEVMDVANLNRSANPDKLSTASGKYQIIDETLRRAMKGVGLSENDLFSAENQDKLANWLIENEAGGGKDPAKLAAVWASLPKDASGSGVYDGDKMGNKARVSYDQLLGVLSR